MISDANEISSLVGRMAIMAGAWSGTIACNWYLAYLPGRV